MKPKLLLLCLALVLSGGLFGCSTAPSGALSKSAEGKLFSNRDILCLKSDDASRPWCLKWAISEDTWNDRGLYVTVHARGRESSSDSPNFTAAIYLEEGGRFKLLKRLESENGFFDKPAFAWTKDRTHLLQITEIMYGTGVFTEDHVYYLDFEDVEPKLEEVEFVPASESFKPYLAKGEGVWKGVYSRLTDDGFFFDFCIWKDGDGNCCPSAGRVTGTYKIERKPDGKLRITMDTFKREPITDSGS
jgi:hypothetical protein